MSKLHEGLERTTWGQYKSVHGPVRETIRKTVVPTTTETGTHRAGPADVLASATLDALS